jgi:hypothetical protein
VPTIRADHVGHRSALSPVRPKAFNAVAFFPPTLRVTVQVSIESKVWISFRDRTKVSSDVVVFISFQRRVINVPGQELNLTVVVALGDDVIFVPAATAKTRWVKAVAIGARNFTLTFEEHSPWPRSQSRENFASSRYEPV